MILFDLTFMSFLNRMASVLEKSYHKILLQYIVSLFCNSDGQTFYIENFPKATTAHSKGIIIFKTVIRNFLPSRLLFQHNCCLLNFDFKSKVYFFCLRALIDTFGKSFATIFIKDAFVYFQNSPTRITINSKAINN